MPAPKDPIKYQEWLVKKMAWRDDPVKVQKWHDNKKGQISWNKGIKIDKSKYPNYGMSGKTHDEETRKKLSLVNIGRKSPCGFKGHKHGPNHNKWLQDKNKVADAAEKRAAKLRGRKYSKAHSNAISKSLIGRIVTWGSKISEGKKKAYAEGRIIPWNKGMKGQYKQKPEQGEKISKALEGKPKPPRSKEHCEKLRIFAINNSNRRGKQHTYKTIEKIKEYRSKQILPFRDSKPERIMQIALSLNGIKYTKHKVFKDGKGFYHQVDIFIEPNICVEVDGDYIHANPLFYGPEMRINGRYTAGQKWMRDKEVNEKLNMLGYKVIRIWENKIIKDVQTCIEQIIELISVKEAM